MVLGTMSTQADAKKLRVLVVDLDGERRRDVCAILEASEDFSVSAAEICCLLNGEEAPGAVLVGLGEEIGDLEAVELCREIKSLPAPPATVLYGDWAGRLSITSEGRDLLFTLSLADGCVSNGLVRNGLLTTLRRLLADVDIRSER